MPLADTAGKLSYPMKTKLNMFSYAFECLSSWRERVFFYLCMEDPKLWKPVFGFEYRCNEEFETAMKKNYTSKIELARSTESRKKK